MVTCDTLRSHNYQLSRHVLCEVNFSQLNRFDPQEDHVTACVVNQYHLQRCTLHFTSDSRLTLAPSPFTFFLPPSSPLASLSLLLLSTPSSYIFLAFQRLQILPPILQYLILISPFNKGIAKRRPLEGNNLRPVHLRLADMIAPPAQYETRRLPTSSNLTASNSGLFGQAVEDGGDYGMHDDPKHSQLQLTRAKMSKRPKKHCKVTSVVPTNAFLVENCVWFSSERWPSPRTE